ncbi:hypothetical protein LB521_27695 [Mesorhizobium sp. BR-1-1-8]|uniref:hypothetical protein n=1 Tax=Mesorhizobium sp. BR-1-1-8 TaxID=2876659 RepID=UPI001CCCF1B8|nr:hypothetical protein [Mesorhizobium sp. BR-1-1-8]MBZ9984921.1 hypothetical protein [Mesorhizobium sp. BR-1-1-8]
MAVPIYSVGTATLTAGSNAMVGQGTLWVGSVRPYDMVIGQDGSVNLVLSVEDNTHITLLFNWGGATQTAQAYRILYTADDPFTQTLVRQVMQSLAASALVALGGLTAAARQGVYFDATSTAALFDLSDAGRALLDDADASAMLTTLGFSDFLKTLVNDADAATARGTLGLAAVAASGSASDLGSGTLPNARVSATLTADKAFRQGNILATVAQSAGVPTGGLIEAGSNSNGDYVRFADGTQICWRTIVTVNTTANTYFTKTELFAATFSAAPRCVISPITSNVSGVTAGYWRANTVSTIAIEFVATVNAVSTNTFNCVAVGRWF